MSKARSKAKAIAHPHLTQVEKRVRCQACNGTGSSRTREYQDCDRCDGIGTVWQRRKMP